MSKFGWFVLILTTLSSCITSKRTVEKELSEHLDTAFYKKQLTGVLIVNTKTKDTIFKSNAEKYFTPASNVKLFTFYSGLKLIPENIPALSYQVLGDTLYVQGTGDPTFLNPNLPDSTAYYFLKKNTPIAINLNNYVGDKFMPGWAWEDYEYYFSPELNPFPAYRNVVEVQRTDSLLVSPNWFKNDVSVIDSRPNRNPTENKFNIHSEFKDTVQIPFITSDSLLIKLLKEELQVSINQTDKVLENKKILYGMPTDSIYKQMLWDSDNFTAEQLMLVASSKLSDTLHFKTSRDFILKNHLQNLRQPPRWVDGSGLSRYNLFSPESFVHLLEKIQGEVDKKRLFELLPAWTSDGTVTKPKKDGGYFIYAKSGSMGNTYNLSGYLRTKKGDILTFSFMNNHFMEPTSEIKNRMYNFLKMVHKKF